MTYVGISHSYILTNEYLLNNGLNVDRISSTNPNKLKIFLNQNSKLVYDFIHSYVAEKDASIDTILYSNGADGTAF